MQCPECIAFLLLLLLTMLFYQTLGIILGILTLKLVVPDKTVASPRFFSQLSHSCFSFPIYITLNFNCTKCTFHFSLCKQIILNFCILQSVLQFFLICIHLLQYFFLDHLLYLRHRFLTCDLQTPL